MCRRPLYLSPLLCWQPFKIPPASPAVFTRNDNSSPLITRGIPGSLIALLLAPVAAERLHCFTSLPCSLSGLSHAPRPYSLTDDDKIFDDDMFSLPDPDKMTFFFSFVGMWGCMLIFSCHLTRLSRFPAIYGRSHKRWKYMVVK